jgi:hypothetical protein
MDTHPGRRALNAALERLAERSGARAATVLDEGFAVWGEAYSGGNPDSPLVDQVDRFYRTEIEPRISEMRRGISIGMQNVAGPDYYVAKSFASLYVAVVWFGGPFTVAPAHDVLSAALPEIEALTLALPPWDGPGAGSGAARQRAG